MKTIDWLRSLHDPFRTTIPPAFRVKVDGGLWLGSTNGHGLTLVAQSVDEELPPFAGVQSLMDRLAKAKWKTVDFAAVMRWAALPGQCAECHGIGFEPTDLTAFDKDGSGPIDGLWRKCSACDALRPGTIHGVTINRFLLLQHVGPLKTERVQVAARDGGKMLVLRCDDWLVMLMACRTVEGDVFKEAA